MRAAVVESYGKPVSQHVKLTTMPTPTVDAPTELLVRVLSASLNPIDRVIVSGDMKSLLDVELPAKLGFDVSGVVERVGPGVTKFKAGDEVRRAQIHTAALRALCERTHSQDADSCRPVPCALTGVWSSGPQAHGHPRRLLRDQRTEPRL